MGDYETSEVEFVICYKKRRRSCKRNKLIVYTVKQNELQFSGKYVKLLTIHKISVASIVITHIHNLHKTRNYAYEKSYLQMISFR